MAKVVIMQTSSKIRRDWVAFYRKRAFILMYKVYGHGRYFSAKRRYCVVLQRYQVDLQRKGARLGRYTTGSFLPRKKLGRYQVAIGRDFIDYERIGRTFLKEIYTKKRTGRLRGADASLAQLQTCTFQSRSVSTEKLLNLYKNF